jgi:hypothetical protein
LRVLWRPLRVVVLALASTMLFVGVGFVLSLPVE